MTDRQLDLYKWGSNFLSIPKYIPGRLNADDFLYFKWCAELEPIVDRYTVVIESLDNAGATMRSISKLREAVEIPYVQLGWYPRLGLVPDSDKLPLFEGQVIRGSLYIIPETKGINGKYLLRREGMLRPN